jgi:hypothetical protein
MLHGRVAAFHSGRPRILDNAKLNFAICES